MVVFNVTSRAAGIATVGGVGLTTKSRLTGEPQSVPVPATPGWTLFGLRDHATVTQSTVPATNFPRIAGTTDWRQCAADPEVSGGHEKRAACRSMHTAEIVKGTYRDTDTKLSRDDPHG